MSSLPTMCKNYPMSSKNESSAHWYGTDLGRSLIEAERERLRRLLPDLYGPIALRVSGYDYPSMLEFSEAIVRVGVREDNAFFGGASAVSAIAEALPFETKSIGLVLLPHILEFSGDPHQVLREVNRVLVPEGHLVLVGFNPVSLWGLRALLAGNRNHYPWTGRYYRLSRVKDWLHLLGFETESGEMAYYRPPTSSIKMHQRFAVFDRIGDRWWPMMAAVYILIARKREIGMTPIDPGWRKNKRLAPGLAEPVTKTIWS